MCAATTESRALSGGGYPIDVDTGPSALVRGSRDEFTSVFRDLASDTVRHTPSGGSFTLRWHIEADGRGAFSANDPGIGIAAERLSRPAGRATVSTGAARAQPAPLNSDSRSSSTSRLAMAASFGSKAIVAGATRSRFASRRRT